MADGDQSLDGGYLGERIAECYERLGEPDAARYWYGRAVEENPEANGKAAEARQRLGAISISDLASPNAEHPMSAMGGKQTLGLNRDERA
jgi:hypothetical protein